MKSTEAGFENDYPTAVGVGDTQILMRFEVRADGLMQILLSVIYLFGNARNRSTEEMEDEEILPKYRQVSKELSGRVTERESKIRIDLAQIED